MQKINRVIFVQFELTIIYSYFVLFFNFFLLVGFMRSDPLSQTSKFPFGSLKQCKASSISTYYLFVSDLDRITEEKGEEDEKEKQK